MYLYRHHGNNLYFVADLEGTNTFSRSKDKVHTQKNSKFWPPSIVLVKGCVSVKCIPPHTPLLYSKTGVYLFFLFSMQKIDCGYSLEQPQRAALACTDNQCFEQKYLKYQNFSNEIFNFAEQILRTLHGHVFVMYYGLI